MANACDELGWKAGVSNEFGNFLGIPVGLQIRSDRTCAPSTSEREANGSVGDLTTNAEVKSISVRVTDSSAPGCALIIMYCEHRLRIDSIVVLSPRKTFILRIVVVLLSASVSISPQVAEVVNECISRVVNTIVDILYHILLGEFCRVGQSH